MLHLTRWRIVGATAVTAAVAAGAFGLSASVASPPERPAAIELRSVTGTTPVVTEDDRTGDGTVASSTITPTAPSPVTADGPTVDSIVSPAGPIVRERAEPPPPPPPADSPGSVSSPSSFDS